jgi:hypothetical protein
VPAGTIDQPCAAHLLHSKPCAAGVTHDQHSQLLRSALFAAAAGATGWMAVALALSDVFASQCLRHIGISGCLRDQAWIMGRA